MVSVTCGTSLTSWYMLLHILASGWSWYIHNMDTLVHHGGSHTLRSPKASPRIRRYQTVPVWGSRIVFSHQTGILQYMHREFPLGSRLLLSGANTILPHLPLKRGTHWTRSLLLVKGCPSSPKIDIPPCPKSFILKYTLLNQVVSRR